MMSLTGLFKLVDTLPDFGELISRLEKREAGDIIILEAARPYLIGALARRLRRPLLVVCADTERSRLYQEQVAAWLSTEVKRFPEPDILPYDRMTSDSSTELERVQVLSGLARCGGTDEPPIVVTSVPAIMRKVPPADDFRSTCQTIMAGMELDPYILMEKLQRMGYRLESIVEVPGTVSHRGGIIDVYPPSNELPARLEFFGNQVESIRLFEPGKQRSVRRTEALMINPATELLGAYIKPRRELEEALHAIGASEDDMSAVLDREDPSAMQFYSPLFNRDSILDYLPENSVVVLDEPSSLRESCERIYGEGEQLRSDKAARGEIPGSFPRPYFTWEEMEGKLKGKIRLALTAWGEGGEGLNLGFASAPSFAGQLPMFLDKVEELLDNNKALVIISHQAQRLAELLDERGIIAEPVNEINEVPVPGSVTLVPGLLAEGWVLGNTYVLTDCEAFGFVKQRRLQKRRPVPHHKLFVDISPGDYVVHIEHGIGRFSGLVTMGKNSTEKEYLVLQYAAGDRLYVPADQVDRVERYIGAKDETPNLSRLGTQEWVKSRQKAKEAAEELAQELLGLYATREVKPGFAFSPDTVWQQELEGSFPYVETPDQLQAQEEVKEDMEKPRPMDRLVCGDVGYGKTEVAVRAAFKAVMDGKQVAVLVPTTVLAEQHYATFTERMKAFPVKIESLSRFKTPREQKAVIEGLVSGQVDICIGTHRLLQKDVVFKDPGLVIIDEEQRFGVMHKEHLKKLREEVDVLTLSATPIPRTLHMSLAGVRDMSVIETPPEERLPIKTFVAEHDWSIIRQAVLREIERNGQVFFVHNRVQSIALVARQLEEIVPEARIAIAHGQMPEERLEKVMTEFARGESHILLCTTIIESGLDMPNVNTVIINQADRLGLTQLYQLRGRVGRGANLAYAYLLYDKGKRLTTAANKRLRTIYEATQLGAGFNIAMKDLEIRGAGTLLGVKQSGQISAVGFSLYTRLLAQAVEKLKAQRETGSGLPRPSLPAPTIDLPLKAYIPADYVSDLALRLDIYRELVKLDAPQQTEGIERELEDRFGAPPAQVRDLLFVAKIRALAASAHVEAIRSGDGQITVSLLDGLQVSKQKLGLLREKVTIGSNQLSLNLRRLGNKWPQVLEEALQRMS